jgi:hypothetical protein
MRTMIQSGQKVPQFEAVALIEEDRRLEPNLVRENPENKGAHEEFPLEEARRLARDILRLDGLTGAEIEAAEHVLSVDRADLRRLREIAGNHAMLTPEFFNLNGSGPNRQENRRSGIGR